MGTGVWLVKYTLALFLGAAGLLLFAMRARAATRSIDLYSRTA